MHRPTSVTFISVFLLVMCAINFYTIGRGNWERVTTHLFIVSHLEALVGLTVTAICALFMLRGANWARWLYIGQVVIGTVALAFFANSLTVFAVGALKTVVFTFFLTKKDAQLFFKSGAKNRTQLSDTAI